jgi:hypothetical protein
MIANTIFTIIAALAFSVTAQNCGYHTYPQACDDDPSVCGANEVCVTDARMTHVSVRVCVPNIPCTPTGPDEQGSCDTPDEWCYATEQGNICLIHPLCWD